MPTGGVSWGGEGRAGGQGHGASKSQACTRRCHRRQPRDQPVVGAAATPTARRNPRLKKIWPSPKGPPLQAPHVPRPHPRLEDTAFLTDPSAL